MHVVERHQFQPSTYCVVWIKIYYQLRFQYNLVRAMFWPRRKDDYARFVDAFAKRYKEELKHAGLIPEMEMLRLYFEFKGSGKTPEQWLEQQEFS